MTQELEKMVEEFNTKHGFEDIVTLIRWLAHIEIQDSFTPSDAALTARRFSAANIAFILPYFPGIFQHKFIENLLAYVKEKPEDCDSHKKVSDFLIHLYHGQNASSYLKGRLGNVLKTGNTEEPK